MSIAIVRKSKTASERPTLSPEKGSELLGLLLLAVGVFLVLSLGSYHPEDPSLFHRVAGEETRTLNWVGPAGAQISAVAFTKRRSATWDAPPTTSRPSSMPSTHPR